MRYRHEPGVSCVNDDGALRPRTADNRRSEVESHGVERESNVTLHINHLEDRARSPLLGLRPDDASTLSCFALPTRQLRRRAPLLRVAYPMTASTCLPFLRGRRSAP